MRITKTVTIPKPEFYTFRDPCEDLVKDCKGREDEELCKNCVLAHHKIFADFLEYLRDQEISEPVDPITFEKFKREVIFSKEEMAAMQEETTPVLPDTHKMPVGE